MTYARQVAERVGLIVSNDPYDAELTAIEVVINECLEKAAEVAFAAMMRTGSPASARAAVLALGKDETT